MKISKILLFVTLTALLYPFLGVAQEKESEKLGKVDFPISCSGEAPRQFDRALAALHSFWYEEALREFTAVTETDPSCAVGYWGIAMSIYYPLWFPPNQSTLQKGLNVVEKAKSIGAKTDREGAYIAAIEAFYKGSNNLDHRTRTLAYEQAMERLYLQYPKDKEAAIIYALALNATALPTDKTYANQLKAGEILEKVFAQQPNHPGVAHYIIHSYDNPPLARRGLTAARRYASIAPSAPHALHMPSHIFTRLGYWQESIESNRASRAVADLPGRLHASDYMTYAYLQVGQDLEAKRVVEELSALRKVDAIQTTAYALAAIPARYALERRQWAEAASLTPHPSDFAWNRFPMAEAITLFARGLGAARSGDLASARGSIEKLQSIHDALVQAKDNYWAKQVEIQRRAATAWVALAAGKNDEALKLMQSAADLEDSTEKHPVTPAPILPARELLGEMLLEIKQPAAALKEFEVAIQKEPNHFRGLYGAGRAAELSGDFAKARSHYAALLVVAEKVDTDRPELKHARAFLAK